MPKELLTDLAGELLSGKKINLDTILDSAGSILGGGKSYPVISATNWKKLIARFRSNVPTNINKRWVADALGISQTTAENSVLPALKEMGIVTRDDKSTKLAESLGSESGYQSAVGKILKAEYPEELLAMDYETKMAQNKIVAWFKRSSGESDAKVKSMANLYVLLRNEYETDVTASSTSTTKKTTRSRASRGVSINVKLDFTSKAAAETFVNTLEELVQQLDAKISKL